MSAARSKHRSSPRLQDELVDQVVAQREADDLLEQRLRSPCRTALSSRQTSSMLFSSSRMLSVLPTLVVLQLVQVEPLQQLAGGSAAPGRDMIERRWASSSLPADDGRRLGLERQRVRPDADLDARRELDPLAAEHFGLADQATVEADVFQLEVDRIGPDTNGLADRELAGLAAEDFLLPDHAAVDADVSQPERAVVAADDGLPLGDERAFENERVAGVAAD